MEQGGGAQILQMFQIQQNSDLPPESCKNKSLVSHFSHRKREKWGLSAWYTDLFFLQHVRQSGEVCGSLFTSRCFMFKPFSEGLNLFFYDLNMLCVLSLDEYEFVRPDLESYLHVNGSVSGFFIFCSLLASCSLQLSHCQSAH